MLRLRLLLVLSIGACGGGASPNIDAAVPRIDAGGDYRSVFAQYGTIETIAGTGSIEGKGSNGWQSVFEGQPAVNAELSRPHFAQADASGNIFVADKDGHGIRKIDPSGLITTFAGTSVAGNDGDGPGVATNMRLSSPNGLWVSGRGAVYILDLGNDKVRKVVDGTMETLFSIEGASTGRGLWVADDESLAYVAAGSVLKKWTPDGGIEVLARGFVSLANFYVEASGSLLACDRGGQYIKI